MRILKKSKFWRGLTSVFVVLSCLLLFMGNLAFAREADINTFLKLAPPELAVTTDTNYYPSEYKNKTEMMAAEKLHDIRLQEEGTVLLQNKNNALPLLSSEKRVTLFGNSSLKPVYKGNAGGSVNSSPTTFVAALGSQGFEMNPTINDALSKSNVSRSHGSIGEVPSTFYNSYQTSFASDYNKAAIITFSRFGGEMQDLVAKKDGDNSEASMRRDANGDPVDLDGVPMLALHPSEKGVLEFVKNSGKFGKIIVVLNSAYPMDCAEIADIADAILLIGNPGTYGFEGVVNCITGKADPSGRTVDTFATSSLSSPAMRNYGDFTFSNLSTLYKSKYVIYAEGIYTGYKYYETRYQDQVLGINDANSTKGVYSGTGGWDYAEEMMYTLGYGKNYTQFTQTIKSIKWDRTKHQVTAVVTVKNDGTPTGSNFDSAQVGSKSVVELYVQLPFNDGNAEKSAIQLIGFGKTSTLKKNETEDVTITVDDYLFATYDKNAANGLNSTKKGCYVFDIGKYYFAVGNDAHDALNNVLAARGKTGMFDAQGVAVSGDSGKTVTEELTALDNTTHAKSASGELVYNQLDDVDINNWLPDGSKITYLTRKDWKTYPSAITGLTATDEMKVQMEGKVYTKPSNAPNISSFKYGTKDTVITKKFIEMKEVAWDDNATWEEYLNQFSISDLATIPGEKMANPAIKAVGIPANKSGDGPDGLQMHSVQHPCEVVAAQTYNVALIEERGKIIGENGIYVTQHGVYGPGANLHRMPYNGRNQEYYSEDAIISYYMGAAQVKGMREKGMISFIKHFVGNDQEINRHGVATMMTEQTLRQNDLRAFEGAFTKGETLGTMTCYNRIGLIAGGAHYGVMTQILRNEWAFKGINLTDSSKDASSYMYTAESVAAGTNQFNNDADRSDDIRKLLTNDKDGYIWQKSRDTLKYYTYAYLHSFVTNGLSANTEIQDWTPWWQIAVIALQIVVYVLTAMSAAIMVLSYVVFSKKRKETETAEVAQ